MSKPRIRYESGASCFPRVSLFVVKETVYDQEGPDRRGESPSGTDDGGAGPDPCAGSSYKSQPSPGRYS